MAFAFLFVSMNFVHRNLIKQNLKVISKFKWVSAWWKLGTIDISLCLSSSMCHVAGWETEPPARVLVQKGFRWEALTWISVEVTVRWWLVLGWCWLERAEGCSDSFLSPCSFTAFPAASSKSSFNFCMMWFPQNRWLFMKDTLLQEEIFSWTKWDLLLPLCTSQAVSLSPHC